MPDYNELLIQARLELYELENVIIERIKKNPKHILYKSVGLITEDRDKFNVNSQQIMRIKKKITEYEHKLKLYK